MTFNEDAQLDTSQVESGGRSSRGMPGGGLKVGGGIGGLIVLILMLVFGGDLIGGGTTQTEDGGVAGQSSPLDAGPAF